MLRFYFVIIINIFAICYYIPRMRYCVRHKDRYSLEKRFSIAKRIVKIITITGNIRIRSFGTENLPDEGGYVMYGNHQGRFDALAVIQSHDKPFSVVMDLVRSHLPIATEVVDMMDGKRLERNNLRQQVSVIHEITDELKEGKRFLVYPEAGYENNGNHLQPFHAGAFKCAMRSQCPIVPVVIVDSYKIFTISTLRRVTCKIYYLPPISPSEYQGMTSSDISDMVYQRIQEQLTLVLG